MGDVLNYDVDIDLYSLQDRTPGEKLSTIMQLFQGIIVPLAGPMAEQGINIDFQGLLQVLGNLSGINELTDILKYEMRPEADASPSTLRNQSRGGGTPQTTTRRYERVSRPGASQQGQEQVLQQILAGGNPQQSERNQLGQLAGVQ